MDYSALAKDVFEAKDHLGHWDSVVENKFFLSGFCLDPEFHDMRPWEDAEAREALLITTEKLFPTIYPNITDETEKEDKMREIEAGYLIYFSKSGIFSRGLIWPRVDKDTGAVNDADLTPTYLWYQTYGASMGAALPFAIKITAQTGAAGISERMHKVYKFHVDKRRTALAVKRNNCTSTAPRLLKIAACLHLEEVENNKVETDESYLRDFNLTDEAKWMKKFINARVAPSQMREFKCYIEDWEDPTGKTLTTLKTHEIKFKLAQKYKDMRIFDEGTDNNGDKYSDHRVVVEVDWANHKGWQVVTQLVGQEEDPDMNQGYLVNSTLPPLLKAGKNPGVKLIFEPTVAL